MQQYVRHPGLPFAAGAADRAVRVRRGRRCGCDRDRATPTPTPLATHRTLGPTDYTMHGHQDRAAGRRSNDVWTFYFREGMKFSDGSPFTVHDVLFWWNDLQLNDLYREASGAAAPHQGILPGSVPEAIDDYPCASRCRSRRQITLILTGDRAERHFLAQSKAYLSQFHATYTDADPWRHGYQNPRSKTGTSSWRGPVTDAPQLSPYVARRRPTRRGRIQPGWAVDEANQQPYTRGFRTFLLVRRASCGRCRACTGPRPCRWTPWSGQAGRRSRCAWRFCSGRMPATARTSPSSTWIRTTSSSAPCSAISAGMVALRPAAEVERTRGRRLVQGIKDDQWFVPEATPLLNRDLSCQPAPG